MLEIELPVDLVADLSAQATAIVADLFPIWALVGGIGLGLTIILWVLTMLTEARIGRRTIEQRQILENIREFDPDAGMEEGFDEDGLVL